MSFFVPGSGPIWSTGVLRAMNIMIGCIVALLSLFLWPKSTKSLIVETVQSQMIITAECAEKVLNLSYESFTREKLPIHWDSFLNPDDADERLAAQVDDAYETYRKSMRSWRSCSEQFPMLRYDPFFWSVSPKERAHFENHMSVRSRRTFRTQMNLVILESFVRGGVVHEVDKESFKVIRDLGNHIQVMLDLRNPLEQREQAVQVIVETDLVQVRQYIERLREDNARNPTSGTRPSLMMRVQKSISTYDGERLFGALESSEQMVLFLQLIEHLIFRVCRLHHFCLDLSNTS